MTIRELMNMAPSLDRQILVVDADGDRHALTGIFIPVDDTEPIFLHMNEDSE